MGFWSRFFKQEEKQELSIEELRKQFDDGVFLHPGDFNRLQVWWFEQIKPFMQPIAADDIGIAQEAATISDQHQWIESETGERFTYKRVDPDLLRYELFDLSISHNGTEERAVLKEWFHDMDKGMKCRVIDRLYKISAL